MGIWQALATPGVMKGKGESQDKGEWSPVSRGDEGRKVRSGGEGSRSASAVLTQAVPAFVQETRLLVCTRPQEKPRSGVTAPVRKHNG